MQQEAGLLVVGCREALVYHEELIDDRKHDDMPIIDEDNGKLFAKWNLPDKFSYPDPVPGYRQLMIDRKPPLTGWIDWAAESCTSARAIRTPYGGFPSQAARELVYTGR